MKYHEFLKACQQVADSGYTSKSKEIGKLIALCRKLEEQRNEFHRWAYDEGQAEKDLGVYDAELDAIVEQK